MMKLSLYGLLKLVRDVDVNFDVSVVNTAEHEIERNCGHNDDEKQNGDKDAATEQEFFVHNNYG